MSKNDLVMRHGPFTQRGVSLGTEGRGVQLEIHEYGVEQMGEWWNFQNVCTPFWRVYYNSAPGCSVRSGGKLYALDPGHVVVVPESVTFDCIGQPGAMHLWMHFSLHSALSSNKGIQVIAAHGPYRDIAATLRDEIVKNNNEIDRIRHICTAFLHLVFAEMSSLDVRPWSPRHRAICDFIDANLATPLNNPLLARQAGMSVEGFIRWFKKAAERTPGEYIAEQRVREACRRLAFSEMSIEEVAESVGFSNRHHFSRVFKRYAGCGPANFRSCRARPDAF